MPGRIRLRTARLRLREWRLSDARRYSRACNTAAVTRWTGAVQSAAEIRDDVSYFIHSEKHEGFTYWFVERASDKALLGFAGLLRIEEEDCPFTGEVEIGWRMRESVWRRGYGFEAASAVLDFAFNELRIERIVSRAAKRNAASLALMAKLGMKRREKMEYGSSRVSDKLAVCTITAKQWATRVAQLQRSERSGSR